MECDSERIIDKYSSMHSIQNTLKKNYHSLENWHIISGGLDRKKKILNDRTNMFYALIRIWDGCEFIFFLVIVSVIIIIKIIMNTKKLYLFSRY